MVNIIGYKQLPDESEFRRLYVDENMSQSQLALIYGCGKKRINRWITRFGLDLRCRGGGNNRLYSPDEANMRLMVESFLSNEEIATALNMTVRSVKDWLSRYGIRRTYSIGEYQRYQNKVRVATNRTYSKFKRQLNPLNLPRTLCGVKNGFQVDHIIPVTECFIKGISVEECADINNLQFIPWEENLKRRTKKFQNRRIL